MKKLAALLAGAMLMMSFTTVANALTLRLTNGVNSVTVTDGGVGDGNATSGVVMYNGLLGDFIINVSTGISNPVLGSFGSPFMDLNSINVSTNFSAPSTLQIYLTDTFFTGVVPDFTSLIGGVTAGTVAYKTYIDSGNVEFAETTLLTDMIYNTGSFSGSATSSLLPAISGPYSLTQEIDITHYIGASVTSFNATIAPVPEPGTMVLLGFGMLGLAIYGKRRMNKES